MTDAPRDRMGRRIVEIGQLIKSVHENADLHPRLARSGVDRAYLDQGSQLHGDAFQHYQRCRSEYGEYAAAEDALDTIETRAYATQRRIVRLGRLAFKDDVEAQRELRLNGPRRQA